MIKLPWLRSRKRLIVQAIINSFIFLSVYFLRFEDNVFFENKFEIFLFLFVWIIISYVLGLLSTSLERLYVRNFNILQLLRDLFKNLISYFLVGLLYIIYFYLFKSFNEIKNIQNFFCFLLIVSTLSFFFRLLFKYIFSLYSLERILAFNSG